MNRHRVWELVEIAKSGDAMSHAVDIALMALIILNVIGVVIGSMPSVDAAYGDMLWLFEVFSVAVFTVEYGIRIWVCKEDMRYAGPAGRARYVVSPMAIIDLLAILPFYLPFVGVDARIMRIFRLFRLVRILKLGRYSKAFGIIGRVFAAKKEESEPRFRLP